VNNWKLHTVGYSTQAIFIPLSPVKCALAKFVVTNFFTPSSVPVQQMFSSLIHKAVQCRELEDTYFCQEQQQQQQLYNRYPSRICPICLGIHM